jgi:hypothetical protein
MRFLFAALVIAVVAFTASCPTPCVGSLGACGPVPNPNPSPDTGCSTTSQALAIRLAGEISFTADHGGKTCVPTSTKCGDTASCSVNVGDVAVGVDEVVKVTIANFGQGAIDVSGVSVESATPDWYVEGQPPTVIGPNAKETVSLVLRPSAVGNCDGNLVVTSDATNPPRGNVALTLHANCVAGAATGCSTTGACCCANGATSGDPICDGTGRVSCGTGFIGFDDACTVAPCTP